MIKYLSNVHKIGDAHVWTIIMQSLNIKERKLLELQSTQTRHHLSIFGREASFNTPQKFMKCAQNKRCTSSICEQSLSKIWISRNVSFWSYILHKLGTPKVLQTDGWTSWRKDGPITRPVFRKAMQVINEATFLYSSLKKRQLRGIRNRWGLRNIFFCLIYFVDSYLSGHIHVKFD